MDDLISRQEAIDAMHQYSHYDDFDTLVLDEDIAVIALKELPSAEPEIIRCKECAYVRIHGDSYRTHMYYCTQTDCDTKLDGYCFRARRKE